MDEEKSEALEEFADDFALLIEGGFIAGKQLDEMSATRMFHAAQVINPKSSAPKVGLGHIALLKNDLKNATILFEEAVAMDAENHLAQCFLGICFLLTKDKMKKGEKIIQEAMEKTADETIKNFGKMSLEWSKKDLSKKSKSPYEL